MPRQIIDTESSRPAYNRRRIRRAIVTLLLLAILVAACWFLARHLWGQETRAAGGSAAPQYLSEKGVLGVVLTPGIKDAA